jgi:HlyD family secretion protein
MRTLIAVVISVVLLPAAISNSEQARLPTLSADTVTLGEVRRGSEIGAVTELDDSHLTLLVERPVDAREGAQSSVFVVDEDGVFLRRVPVAYGRGSPSLIQIVSGLSAGDRIIVSDMQAWDAFDRLRLRFR